MDDDLNKSNYQQDADDWGGDPEVPLSTHSVLGSDEAPAPTKKEHHAAEKVGRSLQWTWTAIIWLWTNIITKRATFWTAAATVVIAAATVIYTIYAKRQWDALVEQNRAYVTIGRPDGVVAETVWPKDPAGKAGIIMYFHNNGHVPARFNWGNDSQMVAVLPTDPNIVKESEMQHTQWSEFDTDHIFQPMWRKKDRKTGAISWSGTSVIGGDSLYSGVLWDIPAPHMIQAQTMERPFVISGKFEYCDSSHHYVCHRFSLIYFRDPFNRFNLVNEDECFGLDIAILHPDPNVEYLSPCDTGLEREEIKIPKGFKVVTPQH